MTKPSSPVRECRSPSTGIGFSLSTLGLCGLEEIRKGLTSLADEHARGLWHIELTDEDGQTALMLATTNDKIDNIKLLLAAGADITLQDKWGTIASQRAKNEETKILFENASRGIRPTRVEVGLEVAKLPFKITGIPEQHLVEEFSPRRPNQALHEGV